MDMFEFFNRAWNHELDQHPHVQEERAELFHCWDGGSTEVEYLKLLYSIVDTMKPMCILETGTWGGLGTQVLSMASLPHSGRIHTLDIQEDSRERVKDLSNVTFYCMSSLDFIRDTSLEFDFAFIDSDIAIRATELELLITLQKIRSGSIVCIHDTSRLRKPEVGSNDKFYRKFDTLRPMLKGVLEFPLSRGMIVCQVL